MPNGRKHKELTLVLILLTLTSAGIAQSPRGPAGEWVFKLGSRALIVLTISPQAEKHGPVSGSLARARHFQTSDNWSFSEIHGGAVTAPIVKSVWRGDTLAITVRNPQDSSDEDTFLFTMTDETHARLEYEGFPLPPLELVRASGIESVATDWDRGRTYSADDGLPSNEQMKVIFDEDQRVRQPGASIDWVVVNKSDAARREAVTKLLSQGALHTGEDFNRAAFVFQHGSTPNDYLLAHTLAMIAVSKGYDSALWIATATLDRYLQSIHQPQIYGTQFLTPQGKPTTQDPYDRALISDALRRRLGVPIQTAQEEQRRKYDAERGMAK
jgi:hypothetical protein